MIQSSVSDDQLKLKLGELGLPGVEPQLGGGFGQPESQLGGLVGQPGFQGFLYVGLNVVGMSSYGAGGPVGS